MSIQTLRVLVFVSEVLSAKTLLPIIAALRSDPTMNVKVVNDGFCLDFVRSLELPVEFILNDFEARIDCDIRSSSVVLMGKSYVQPSEYAILRRAAHWRVPVLLAIPDMGIDVVRAKLKGIGGDSPNRIPWPTILLADHRTRRSIGSIGVPEGCVVEFGNPYFDDLYDQLWQDRSEWKLSGIGYFSTPFELDFERGILPADYRQKDLITDIIRTCQDLGQPLTGKRHPQVAPALFEGMHVFDGSPLEMIRTIRVAVGSYSTTLMEAYSAGIPTLSFQPWEANIREDVFEGRIPILKTTSALKDATEKALALSTERKEPRIVTYHPGCSIGEAIALIKQHAAV